MNIHHTIVKAAAVKGIRLTATDGLLEAFHADSGIGIDRDIEDEAATNEDARAIWSDLQDVLDYNADQTNLFLIRFADGDFVAHRRGAGVDDIVARDPALEDLRETLESIDSEGDDAEAGGVEETDDEEATSGSVVPEKYKAEYAARGNPAHCGDWLALLLERLCRVTSEGKEVTDLDRLSDIASANGVEPARYGKLGIATNGWQGRYRMTVRNMLTKRCADKGHLFVPEGCGVDADTEYAAPADWCAAHATRTRKPKAKAAVSKDEGAGKKSAKTIAAERFDMALAEANRAVRGE